MWHSCWMGTGGAAQQLGWTYLSTEPERKFPGLLRVFTFWLCPRNAMHCFPQYTSASQMVLWIVLFLVIFSSLLLSMHVVVLFSGFSMLAMKASASGEASIWYSDFWCSLHFPAELGGFFRTPRTPLAMVLVFTFKSEIIHWSWGRLELRTFEFVGPHHTD